MNTYGVFVSITNAKEDTLLLDTQFMVLADNQNQAKSKALSIIDCTGYIEAHLDMLITITIVDVVD